jgi:acetyl esterase/lipase
MIMLKSDTRRMWMAGMLGLGAVCGAVAQTTNAPTTNAAPAVATMPAPELLPVTEIESPPDIVYATVNGYPLHAQLSYPKNPTGLLPAIIHIHGGGWIEGSYKFDTATMARHGYFAISIEYRLDNVAKWPAQIEDCKLAVRYLRANAAQYHVDPDRIGVFGDSAGGHLVDCLATMADQTQYDVGDNPGVSSAVQAVVDFYGPTDFTRPDRWPAATVNLIVGLMGTPYAQNPDAWKSASPVCFVKAGDPPVLIVQGVADGIVPAEQSSGFADALEKAGVEHQLILVKNGDHGFKPNPPGSKIDPAWDQINAALYSFFDAHLKKP